MGFMRGRVAGGADAFAAARPARGAEGSNGVSHLCLKRGKGSESSSLSGAYSVTFDKLPLTNRRQFLFILNIIRRLQSIEQGLGLVLA